MLLLPVGLVGFGILTPSVEVWDQLWETRLPAMITSTVGLLALVGLGSLVLGAGLAWLVSGYDFPLRRIFTWALVLPLAMPAYVLGFVFLAIFDFPGPIQTTLRDLFGPDVWFPDVRSLPGAATVMTLTLYPYVYVLARSALREQAPATFESARLLGDGRIRALRRVVLPLARPSLAAGLVVVMMETLNDFATVQYFGVETVSVGVYQVWRGMFDRDAAIEIAALVLVFALMVMAFERIMRGGRRYSQKGGQRGFERVALRGRRAWMATGICAVVVTIALGIPVVQLLVWTLTSPASVIDLPRAVEYLGNSLFMALVAAAGCVVVGLFAAGGARFSRSPLAKRLAPLVTVGYGLPGPVVALGVLVVIGWFVAMTDGSPAAIALVSLTGLTYAYIVRFVAVAYGSIDASLEKVSTSMPDAAHTLGASPWRVLRQIYLPLAKAGIGAGMVLVAIDILKELPIVLMIRPFGFTTASVWVWSMASESRWATAALPALLIVTIALIPIGIYVGDANPLRSLVRVRERSRPQTDDATSSDPVP